MLLVMLAVFVFVIPAVDGLFEVGVWLVMFVSFAAVVVAIVDAVYLMLVGR